MCGIAGIVISSSRDCLQLREILEQMCNKIRHRGPDDSGYYVTPNVALGHRRLSIIDLAGGHQPLFNEDGTIAIVFNGEIYNYQEIRQELLAKGHRFSTNSDTETIVHLYEEYGEMCPDRLNGMFAFAIWDETRKTLFAARDRIGKKPLYYAVGQDYFLFASELKAILEYPGVARILDFVSVAQYLMYEYVPAPATIFRDIRKLEPGYSLKFEQNGIHLRQYWDGIPQEPLKISMRECEERLEILLHDAVKRRLMSEVPLGVFLSGGIDSSCLVAMMSQVLPPREIHTFAIGFSEASFDESRYAQAVADYFGTSHYCKILSAHTMLDIFPDALKILDEPLGDASIIPTYLLSQFTRQYVTVALGGDGGDELFAGYPTFQAHVAAQYYGKIPRILRQSIIEPLVKRLPVSHENISFDFKAKRFLSGVDENPYFRQQIWLGSFTPHELSLVLRPDIHEQCQLDGVYRPITRHLDKFTCGTELERILYLYLKLYLQDDILVKVDRASMAHSLEVRCPFLDVNVVEFVQRLPMNLKLHHFTSKYLLKRILKSKLPPAILRRPKKGFGIPVAQWLCNELKPMLQDLLAPDKIEREGIFHYPYIEKLLREHFLKQKDNRKQLWTLIAFEMWLEQWRL